MWYLFLYVLLLYFFKKYVNEKKNMLGKLYIMKNIYVNNDLKYYMCKFYILKNNRLKVFVDFE